MADGERRLVSGLGAIAFDRLEERGLLARDVGAAALADLDVERPARAEDVIAQQASRPGGFDRPSEGGCRGRVFAADVDVAAFGAAGERGDRHALEDGERVAFHQRAGP